MSIITVEIAEWQKIGSRPIDEDSPSGQDCRHDADFERLQEEIQKLETLATDPKTNKPVPVKWNEVVALCQTILNKKSKHLFVAVYLCRGLLEEEGYRGLLNGFECFNMLITQYWDKLFPSPNRRLGRINAIRWLSEKVGAAVARRLPNNEDKDVVQGCLRHVESWEPFFREQFGPDKGGLGKLRIPLGGHLQDLLIKEDEARRIGEAAKVGPKGEIGDTVKKYTHKELAPLPPRQNVTDAEISSNDDAQRALRDAEGRIRPALSFLRQQDISAVWPYRLIRLLVWRGIESLPPHEGSKTRVPAPQNHIQTLYDALIKRQAWGELVRESEARIHEFPLWLDLHWNTFLGLSNLGSEHAYARDVVTLEIQHFIRRLPQLTNLQFANGKCFAHEQTRQWIQDHAWPVENALACAGATTGHHESENGQLRVSSGRYSDAVDLDLQGFQNEASKLASRGQFKDALALYSKRLEATMSCRGRFFLNLEMAQFCQKQSRLRPAIAQLEVLGEQLTNITLEEWEPELCLKVLKALWIGLTAVAKEPTSRPEDLVSRIDEVYKKICRMSPEVAIELDSDGTPHWINRKATRG